jgi:hypothetical protein
VAIKKMHSLFITHATSESPIALELKSLLSAVFGPLLEIFVSSDNSSIQPGEQWYERIASSIRGSTVLLALVSEESMSSQWLPWEAGVGTGAERIVIPVLIRGFAATKLKPPLSFLQSKDLTNIDHLQSVITRIAAATGLTPSQADLQSFIEEVSSIDSTLISRGVQVEPFLKRKSYGTPYLMFRIRNTGTTNVHPIRLVARAHEGLINPQAIHQEGRPILVFNEVSIKGTNWKQYTYDVNDAPVGHQYSQIQRIPAILTPNMPSIVLENLIFMLRPNLDETSKSLPVEFQLFCSDATTKLTTVRYCDILPEDQLETD